jgi:hypothetical protein
MKWDIHGLPFSPHQSSCSNMKPKMFSWEELHGDVELWVDFEIERGTTTPKKRAKKCAWLCESRAIVPFFSKLYATDEDGNLKVDGITPALQQMIDAYDAIYTCDKELVELHEKIHFCFAGSTLPWVWKEYWDMHYKEELCSFISSNKSICTGHQKRHNLYREVLREFEGEGDKPSWFHVFGSITGKAFGGQDGCHIKGGNEKWHDKSMGLDKYSFSVVIENDIYSSYFTEKLTDCFVTGTIPIYMGAPDIGDYFDTEGMIIVNSVDDIIDVLKEIKMKGVEQYLTKRGFAGKNFHSVTFLESPDDMLYRKIITE